MTDTAKVRTLDDLRAAKNDGELIRIANVYIEAGEAKLREARGMRNDAVRRLALELGPSRAAQQVGMPLSTVKAIRGGA